MVLACEDSDSASGEPAEDEGREEETAAGASWECATRGGGGTGEMSEGVSGVTLPAGFCEVGRGPPAAARAAENVTIPAFLHVRSSSDAPSADFLSCFPVVVVVVCCFFVFYYSIWSGEEGACQQMGILSRRDQSARFESPKRAFVLHGWMK